MHDGVALFLACTAHFEKSSQRASGVTGSLVDQAYAGIRDRCCFRLLLSDDLRWHESRQDVLAAWTLRVRLGALRPRRHRIVGGVFHYEVLECLQSPANRSKVRKCERARTLQTGGLDLDRWSNTVAARVTTR